MAEKKLNLVKCDAPTASLFVQWRYGFSPQAAERFCRRDIRRRPKFAAIKQLSGSELQWLQIQLLVVGHKDTLNAWRIFNSEMRPVAAAATATVEPKANVDGKMRAPLRVAGRAQVPCE